MKYQTNLDTHPPGCISLNQTQDQDIYSPEDFSEHFHGPLPEGFSKPEARNQKTLVKICLEEPKFQAHFPQVRLILCLKDLLSVSFHVTDIAFKHESEPVFSVTI